MMVVVVLVLVGWLLRCLGVGGMFERVMLGRIVMLGLFFADLLLFFSGKIIFLR